MPRFGIYTYCGKVTFLEGQAPETGRKAKALLEPVQAEYWDLVKVGDFVDAYEMNTMIAHGKVLEVHA